MPPNFRKDFLLTENHRRKRFSTVKWPSNCISILCIDFGEKGWLMTFGSIWRSFTFVDFLHSGHSGGFGESGNHIIHEGYEQSLRE